MLRNFVVHVEKLIVDITVPVSPKDANLYLDLDDYLQGLLTMSSELSRFSINCVAKGIEKTSDSPFHVFIKIVDRDL